MNRISKLLSLNTEQNELLNLEKPYVVEASAGSGKTRVLVSRYLQILESGADLQSIVAITFTINAANEMKERVRSYIKLYIDTHGESANINSAALRQITDAPITTIHGFAASIVRENPYECMVNSRIKILEGLDRKIFVEEAADDFITKAAVSNKYIKELFENENYDYVTVKNNLIQILEQSLRHHLSPSDKLLRSNDLIKEINRLYRELKQKIKTSPYGSGNKKIDEKLKEFYALIGQIDSKNLRAHKVSCLSKALLILTNAASPRGILELKASTDIERDFAATCSVILNKLINLYELQNTNTYLNLFLNFYSFYSEKKRASGYLEFEDLMQGTLKLLRDNPDILAEYKSRYKYFLIDEYQDTDRIQNEIINLFSGANTFIVGDPKQSIFGFRGAVPEIFNSLSKGEDRSVLKINYRSDSRLITFFNKLFKLIIKDTYEEMEFVSLGSNKGTVKEVICTETEKGNDRTLLEAKTVAKKVSDLIQIGYDRKDIAVLLRSKSHIEHYERALNRLSIAYYSSESVGFYRYQEVRDVVSMLKYVLNENDKIAEASVLRSVFLGATDEQLLKHYAIHEKNDPINDYLDFVSELRSKSISLNSLELLIEILNRTLYGKAMLLLPDGEKKHDSIKKLIEIFSYQTDQGKSLSEIISFLDLNYEENTEGLSQIQLDESDTVKILTVHKAKGLEFPVVILADMNHGMGGGAEAVNYSEDYGIVVRPKGIKSVLWKDMERKQKEKDLAEEKRSLYVAMTRAKDKLIMSVCSDVRPKSGTYLHVLDGIMPLSKISSEKDHINFKDYVIPVSHYNHSGADSIELDENVGTFDDKIIIQTPSIKTRSSKNKDEDNDNDNDVPSHLSFKLNNVQIGLVMHRFLQIWNFERQSIDSTIQYVVNESYVAEPKMEELLKTLAYNFIESQLFGYIMDSDEIKRELPFYIELDGKRERRKIDLLLFKDGNLSLFDYKLSSEVKAEYIDQMDLYEKALIKKYNCNNISKNLVHVPDVIIKNLN